MSLARETTGVTSFMASPLIGSAAFPPAIAVQGHFYLLTVLLPHVITPIASVVLLIPIAVVAAARIVANEFVFLLAAMFARHGVHDPRGTRRI